MLLNEGKLMIALLSASLLTGCGVSQVKQPPSLQLPTIDERLLQHCPNTYSVLPLVADWDAVQAAHTQDIQQAEACRIKDDELIGVLRKAQSIAIQKNTTAQPQPSTQTK